VLPKVFKNIYQEMIMTRCPSEEICGGCPELSDSECKASRAVRLSNYKPGDKGTILQVCGDPDFRLRMMEMGFIRGTEVQVVKYAPLSDPIEFVIKGYHITLRRDQAADILMQEPEKAA
jgi:Fe2+ transport system protein FeoA